MKHPFQSPPNLALSDPHHITSADSEGEFNDFIDTYAQNHIDDILGGDIEGVAGPRGSDIIIELDDIQPPTFTYGGGDGGSGGRGMQPGNQSESIRFTLPMDRLMELVKRKLGLPLLSKEGSGRIKETTYEFKTFAPTGIILDKRRTFKRALKSSIGMKEYDPDNDQWNVYIRQRDKRYKIPERVEKPKFRAVVFYIGDVSYSTYGDRLKLEKHVVNFIQNWLDYNYGPKNVEHRFFVHEAEAYEVTEDNFYRVTNAGGTLASPVFELIQQVAMEEYDILSTNLYAFYFGDGELYGKDAEHCAGIIKDDLYPLFNRIGITEVMPSSMSSFCETVEDMLGYDSVVRSVQLADKKGTVSAIQALFGDRK